jgi:hypothetical protein
VSNIASLVTNYAWLLGLDSLPGFIALALLHGAPDDPPRDANHRYTSHVAYRPSDDAGWVGAVMMILVDELTRLVGEPIGDVLAGEGASVGSNAKVADIRAPAADVGAANMGSFNWL